MLDGEARNDAVALKEEALGEGGKELVRKFLTEVPFEEGFFKGPLAELEGGVAKEGLSDAIPAPVCSHDGADVTRVNVPRLRREFLDIKRAQEAVIKEGGRARDR